MSKKRDGSVSTVRDQDNQFKSMQLSALFSLLFWFAYCFALTDDQEIELDMCALLFRINEI